MIQNTLLKIFRHKNGVTIMILIHLNFSE